MATPYQLMQHAQRLLLIRRVGGDVFYPTEFFGQVPFAVSVLAKYIALATPKFITH